MLKQVFRSIDTLPLAGKYSIAPAIKGYVESNSSYERVKYTGTQALLVLMVGAHAIQAVLGYESLSTHLNNISSSEVDPLTYVNTTVDALYMTINGLVSARQANLMYRIEDIRKKRNVNRQKATAVELKDKRRSGSNDYISGRGRAALLALGVTIAGQITFMQSYLHAENQADTIACHETVSEYYDEYTENKPDSVFITKDQYIDEACK